MARPVRLASRRAIGIFNYRYPQIPYRLVVVKESAGASLPKASRKGSKGSEDDAHEPWRDARSKLLEGSATALGSIAVLGLAGYSYHLCYKYLVLSKMENAFAAGYSAQELAVLGRQTTASEGGSSPMTSNVPEGDWIPREEQSIVDDIVNGTNQGQYWLFYGEKGTGKTTMILSAIGKVAGEGIAMLEAHGDLEVFRLRLGKALDFEFHEDYVGGLFSFKGPRDTTALLDIERAFNKMEKVALKRKQKTGKPLVLVINGAHLLRHDDEGRDLMELIQQRAEMWAASKLVTVILNSNDYWIAERLISHATRLRVLSVHDIPKQAAMAALKDYRARFFRENVQSDILEQVYRSVGGRLRFLSRVAQSEDIVGTCESICAQEKRWLLNQCWILGEAMDPEAEEHQDRSAAALILAKVLVEKEKEMDAEDVAKGKLPQLPLHEARQIMTRPDFVQELDHMNILTIDANSMVQADSVAMQKAFREICSQESFEQHLQATLDRLDELESLGRTRELTIKDLWGQKGYKAEIESSQKNPGSMVVTVKGVS